MVSSTMPHKRNPSNSESISAIAKAVRHNASLALEAMVGEHERVARSWITEWEFISRSCLMIGAVLEKSIGVLSDLKVNENNMRHNLDILKDLLLSEAIMIKLGKKIGLKKAHEIVYECSIEALKKGLVIYDVLMERNVLEKTGITPDELKEAVSLKSYVGLCSYFVEKITGEDCE